MSTAEVTRVPAPSRTTGGGGPLVVLGTSGHAREIAWIAEQAGRQLLGCVGPHRPAEVSRLPLPWLGPDDWLADAGAVVHYLIGVGAGAVRARLDDVAGRNGHRAASLVSPAAVVGARCTLGDGAVVWPGAVITTDVRLGRHVHVGTRASVSHDTVVDDYATLLPGCTVAGGSRIGRAATVGAGATVIDNMSIGDNSVVGAGAVVTRPVPENVIVVGVPARILRPNTPPTP